MLTSSVDSLGSLAHNTRMQENEIFTECRNTLQTSPGVRQAFAILPAGAEISIQLDNRFSCTLKLDDNGQVSLLSSPSRAADFEFTVYPEAIRRLKSSQPSDFIALYKEIVAAHIVGQVRFRVLASPQDIVKKGYLQALKNLPAELQAEVSKYFYKLVGTATQIATLAKMTIENYAQTLPLIKNFLKK